MAGRRLKDYQGRTLDRAFVFPWRGRILLLGLSPQSHLRPVGVPQKRLTYWAQALCWEQAEAPDFLRNGRQPERPPVSRVCHVIITHLDATRNVDLHSIPSTSSTRLIDLNWWGRSTHRLGRGYLDRIHEEQEEGATRNIPSYNEILQRHFQERIPRWRSIPFNVDENQLATSCDTIVNALELVLDLKALASDYQWEKMRVILRDPRLTYKFEEACSTLLLTKGLVDNDGKSLIGFDWGSCAWRHCGAQADAQEALSELYNGLGLFEPFESLFVIDVIGT